MDAEQRKLRCKILRIFPGRIKWNSSSLRPFPFVLLLFNNCRFYIAEKSGTMKIEGQSIFNWKIKSPLRLYWTEWSWRTGGKAPTVIMAMDVSKLILLIFLIAKSSCQLVTAANVSSINVAGCNSGGPMKLQTPALFLAIK